MLRDLDARLARCTLEDRASLRRRVQRLRRDSQGRQADQKWSRLEQDLSRCEALFERRRVSVPEVSIPAGLPIAARTADIIESIRSNPVTVVSGDTGSGKSTQLPKLCLLAGRGVAGQIAHTQPRRVAARGVARRLAQELGQPLGESVGFKVRFDAKVRRESHVKVLTDGLLLAELSRDRMLRAYDTIIIDEAHERSLNIDFLLGYLKQLCTRRRELRVVVSSATLDVERMAAFFDGAPVVSVEGRSYPVEMRYRPADGDVSLPDQVRGAVAELREAGPGDILVFLSGEREIHDVSRTLKGAFGTSLEVLPLYARLPLSKQDRIFAAHERRRVVLATNVAETSLTVPGVRYVVDAGFERVGRYSPGSAVQRLPVERISKASARQRAGRCGREAPGVCIRLYDEDDYEAFDDFQQPEILRTDLAAILLRMRALGVSDIGGFPFLDPPGRRHVKDGMRLLDELGALDDGGRLSRIGRQLARLPLDPRVGRMLIAADEFDCVAEVLVIASGLSAGDPRERERGQRGIRPQHLRYEDERSDFLRFLRIWDDLQAHAKGGRVGPLAQFCRARRLSFPRIQEWREVHLQLSLAAREMGLRARPAPASYARVHRALLAGLLRQVGQRRDEREYRGIRGNVFRVSRASGQSERRPRWILAAEVVDAGNPFAHTVAGIRAQWVERAAGSLIRRSHFDAWWDECRGEPMVREQTALYSLTVTASRAVRFAPVSESGAREVFIRAALVDERLATEAPFIVETRACLARRRALEARLRRPDPAISDEPLYDFYARGLPAHVWDAASFEAWWPQASASEREALRFQDIARAGEPRGPDLAAVEAEFPGQIETRGRVLGLDYRFAPGEDDDGITVRVPVELLGGLDERSVEWAVPGLLREQVVALLRALPKGMRRRTGPAAQVAADFLAATAPGVDTVMGALARYLAERHAVQVPVDEVWSERHLTARLEPYQRPRYAIVGDEGRVIATGRDLLRLKRRHERRHEGHQGRGAERAACDPELHRSWSFGDLPDRERLVRDGSEGWLYPAVAARDGGVTVVRVDDPQRAREIHEQGLLCLAMIVNDVNPARLARQVPEAQTLCLLNALVGVAPEGLEPPRTRDACDGLLHDLVMAALNRAYLPAGTGGVRDAAAFEALCRSGEAALPGALATEAGLLGRCLAAHREVLGLLDERWPDALQANIDDARQQLAWLVYQGFYGELCAERREHLPRYLEGLGRRLQKLRRGGSRDGEKLAELRPAWERFLARHRVHRRQGRQDRTLQHYRWLLEEYRLSLFAQEVGAVERVSRQRLDRLWATIPA